MQNYEKLVSGLSWFQLGRLSVVIRVTATVRAVTQIGRLEYNSICVIPRGRESAGRYVSVFCFPSSCALECAVLEQSIREGTMQ